MLRFDHFVSDWRDVLPGLGLPTWIVTGAHSPSFPLEGMQWMVDVIPDARLTVYPEAATAHTGTRAWDFNRDLLAMLAGQSAL